jgi:hypothetical protein
MEEYLSDRKAIDGFVFAVVIWLVFSMGSCSRALVYDYPAMKQRCVATKTKLLEPRVIERCYAREETMTGE